MTTCWPAIGTSLRHQQLLNAVRSAGQKSGPALHEQADVLWVKSVDVLARMHGEQNAAGVHLRRQRQLHQYAVDQVVLVESVYQLQQVVEAGIARQPVQHAFDADALARLALVAHVDFAGGIVAHQHSRQARNNAVVFDKAPATCSASSAWMCRARALPSRIAAVTS